MTHKDFETIAKVLFEAMPKMDEDVAAWVTWKAICHRFARKLEQDNLRFDRYRFLDACGVEES